MKGRVSLFLLQYTLQVFSVLLITKIAFTLDPQSRVYWLSALAILPFLGLAEMGSNNMMAKTIQAYVRSGNLDVILKIILVILVLSISVVSFSTHVYLDIFSNRMLISDNSDLAFYGAMIFGVTLKSFGTILTNVIYASGDYVCDKLSKISSSTFGILILTYFLAYETKFGIPITWGLHGIINIFFYMVYNKINPYEGKICTDPFVKKLGTYFAVSTPGILLASAPQFILQTQVGTKDFENYMSIIPVLFGLQGLTMMFTNIHGAELLKGQKPYYLLIRQVILKTLTISFIFLLLFAAINPFYQTYWLNNVNFDWSFLIILPLLLFYLFEWTQIACTHLTMLNGETRYIIQTWLGFFIFVGLSIFWVDSIVSFVCSMFISYWFGVYPRNIYNIIRNLQ